MALWNQPTGGKDPAAKDVFSPAASEPTAVPRSADKPEIVALTRETPRPVREKSDIKESLIAPDLTIEGKIEGSGDVRIAGHFKGDVQVQGNVRIEAGAKVTGEVRANTVIVGGELEGNISAISRVELLETGILNGDLKAGSLIVAAGSRMRGRAEFGWSESKTADKALGGKVGGGSV